MVKSLIAGSVAANEWINANPADAQKVLSEGIQKLTGKPLDAEADRAGVEDAHVPRRPDRRRRCATAPSTPRRSACSKPVDLKGLYDLTLLNEVLKDARPLR